MQPGVMPTPPPPSRAKVIGPQSVAAACAFRRGYGVGEPLDGQTLRDEAHWDASDLYLSNEQLAREFGGLVDAEYPRSRHKRRYCWGSYETKEETRARVGGFCEAVQQRYPGETILLVSHGGPVMYCYEHLLGLGHGSAPLCGYTALFVYREAAPAAPGPGAATEAAGRPQHREARAGSGPAGSAWECLVSADVAHLGDVDQSALGFALMGPSDDAAGCKKPRSQGLME